MKFFADHKFFTLLSLSSSLSIWSINLIVSNALSSSISGIELAKPVAELFVSHIRPMAHVCLFDWIFFHRKLPSRALIYFACNAREAGEFIAYESIFYPDIAPDNSRLISLLAICRQRIVPCDSRWNYRFLVCTTWPTFVTQRSRTGRNKRKVPRRLINLIELIIFH